MRLPSRLVLTATVAAVPAALLATAPAVAHPTRSAGAGVRHVVYLTAGDQIDEVAVSPAGVVGKPVRIAPGPGTPTRNRPAFVVASPDGRWLAWTQARDNKRPLLYLRDFVAGTTTTVATNKTPAGFAGDTLLVTFNRTFKTVLRPKPQFVPVPHAGLALNGYAHGAIHVKTSRHGTSGTLELTSFGGATSRLHQYTDFSAPTYRDVDAAYVSSDQRRLLIERGNHQDFSGLGPCSLADEFSLTGHHHRTPLGHFGSKARVWRIATAAFRGPSDQPYVAWEAQTRSGVPAVVARWSGGRWHRVAGDTISVAADTRGDLLLQPGTYTRPHSPHNRSDYPAPYPTAAATLRLGGRTHTLNGVRGLQFWFAAA